MESRLAALKQRLRDIGPCLVAFSGGVDSTFLLRVAHDVLGDAVLAITAVSPSLAAAERDGAQALARLIGASHLLVETHEIDDPRYVRNDRSRCYFCKSELFRVMREVARAHRGRVLLYGAIPEDLGDDRPGMVAAGESGVRAPLIEAGLSKEMIRTLSRQLGLPTWDKPAMACLASRLPRATPVTREALGQVERAEAAVRSLGYRQVRVRHHGTRARLELDAHGLQEAEAPAARRLLIDAVRAAGFAEVVIDPRGYRPAGSAAPSRTAPA
jgi:uncharacterized protein